MSVGNKKYAEPSKVLKSIIDDFGEPLQIGNQMDITEFKAVLIARISDAFKSLNNEEQIDEKKQEPDHEEAPAALMRKNSAFMDKGTEGKQEDKIIDVEMTEDLVIESNDPISQQVIGTSTSFLWVPNEDGITFEERNYEQNEFTDIMLNFSSPEVSDFYQVWE